MLFLKLFQKQHNSLIKKFVLICKKGEALKKGRGKAENLQVLGPHVPLKPIRCLGSQKIQNGKACFVVVSSGKVIKIISWKFNSKFVG